MTKHQLNENKIVSYSYKMTTAKFLHNQSVSSQISKRNYLTHVTACYVYIEHCTQLPRRPAVEYLSLNCIKTIIKIVTSFTWNYTYDKRVCVQVRDCPQGASLAGVEG